jgi:hypothetical protein
LIRPMAPMISIATVDVIQTTPRRETVIRN